MNKIYCDYIANYIKESINTEELHDVGIKAGGVRWDLHPEGGYYLSTKKFIEVVDSNGTQYLITIQTKGE